jgi:hypothetical protein
MNDKYIYLVYGIATIVIALFLLGMFGKVYENYANYNLGKTYGVYPCSVDNVLVQDTYPAIGKNELSTNDANDIWWYYPIFKVGSYAQITNNIRYSRNPDIGRCMPASMCGALYKDIENKTNYITPLPPVEVVGTGTRINYYNTDVNMLPYRSETANILY